MNAETEQEIANLLAQRTYMQRQIRWLLDQSEEIARRVTLLEAVAKDEALRRGVL